MIMTKDGKNPDNHEILEAKLLSHRHSIRVYVVIFLGILLVVTSGYLASVVIKENPF